MLRCSLLALFLFCLTFASSQIIITGKVLSALDNYPLQGAHVLIKGAGTGAVTDAKGEFLLALSPSEKELEITYPGHETLSYKLLPGDTLLTLVLQPLPGLIDTVLTFDPETYEEQIQIVRNELNPWHGRGNVPLPKENYPSMSINDPNWNTEDYRLIEENNEKQTAESPLSTFSIDVDRAAYANVRRFTMEGARPPKDAVRIEEMINYFHYDYPSPRGDHPLSAITELSDCPWNSERILLHIGLQGKNADLENLPPSNLVFLIDVSGSMSDANKLPLLQSAFKLLVQQLRPEDQVAIVVYAGAAGLVLPPCSGAEKDVIIHAIDKLSAGGSTAGGEGIQLAYRTAKEHFLENGNNRVILATDGDFNVGVSSDAELVRIIEEKRQDGIYLTTLGFGTGNYKDNKLEQLADNGNGNYAYIDNIDEAKKIFVSELLGTLYAIAKDVKIQIEFNPFYVKSYRLVGYENRVLNREDFEDDRKDAGELGVGHSVTALYELALIDKPAPKLSGGMDSGLRYQQTVLTPQARKGAEIAHLSLRYKLPDEDESRLVSHPVLLNTLSLDRSSANFRFSAAVAGFGMLLRESEYNKDLDFDKVLALAKGAMREDEERKEFLTLVERQRELGGEE